MNVINLVNIVLKYLTTRRQTMKTKNVSRRRTAVATATAVCGACGGEVCDANSRTHLRVCFRCGRKVQ